MSFESNYCCIVSLRRQPKADLIADLNTDLIADPTESEPEVVTPKYKLTLNVSDNCLNGHIILPAVYDPKQIDLRIGEDRIVLSASHYKLDIFVSVLIDCNQVITTFDAFTGKLNLKMPLI